MKRPIPLLFRMAAIIEAITWAGLLIGMAFKYLINGDEVGVRIFGSLHGAAFIAYLGMTIAAAVRFRWGFRVAAIGVLAAIPPFFTVFFDLWVERTGRFREEQEAASAAGSMSGRSS